MATVSEANSEDIQGWVGSREIDMGNNASPPKREGGVSIDSSCGGSLEGMCIGGKLWAKVERDPT